MATEHTAMVEVRIEHIADLMRTLKFRTGKTFKELAEEWGLSQATVKNYSAEASKRVMAEVCDPDRVRVAVGVALQTVLEGAVADISNPPMISSGENVFSESPNKSREIVIKAAAQWAEIMGSKAAQKIQHSGAVALDDIDAAKKAALANERAVSGDDDGNDGGEAA